jgi:hypothetical protein
MAVRNEEKRFSPRINCRVPLRVQLRGSLDFSHTLSHDISEGGLSFTCDRSIPRLAPVMLEINILSHVLKPVAQAVWTSDLPHSNNNRLGLKFIEFDPFEKEYLQDYIKMLTAKL